MTIRITVETNNWPAKVIFPDGSSVWVEPRQSQLFTVDAPMGVTVSELEPTPEVEAPKIPLKKSAPAEEAGDSVG